MAVGKFARDGFAPLDNSHTRSHAPLASETVANLAGRAAWLYEQATGDLAGGTDQQPVSPMNPSGRLGHDHSGPPYGSALQHPLWTFSGPQTVSNFTRDNNTNNWDAQSVFVNNTTNPVIMCRCYVRPFPVYDGSPYSLAYPYIAAIHGGASTSINTECWTGADPDFRKNDDISVTDGAWPPQFVTPPDAYWKVEPGWNTFYVKFTCPVSTGVAVYGVSACQIVKRSH